MAERIACNDCNRGQHGACLEPARCPCWCSPRKGRDCAYLGTERAPCDCFPQVKRTEYAVAS